MASNMCIERASLSNFQSEIVNDQFVKLKAVFLATGKGRRPNFPTVVFDNKLLIQLLLLKEEGHKTFNETVSFMQQLLPEKERGSVLPSRLHYLLQNAQQNAFNCIDEDEKKCFLSQLVNVKENLGPFLEGISSCELLHGNMITPTRSPTNGLLKDLNKFRKKRDCTFSEMTRWWHQLTMMDVPLNKFKNATEKMLKIDKKLQANTHRVKGGELYRQFLASCPFQIQQSEPNSIDCQRLPESTSRSPSPIKVAHSLQKDPMLLKLSDSAKSLAAARRKEEELLQKISDMEKQLSTLSQARSESLAELNTVCSENENLRSINAKLDTSNVNLQASLEQKDATIATQQSRLNYYRKLEMKKKLQRKEAKISSLEAELKKNLEQHGYKIKILQCKLRNIQLKFVDLKQKMKRLKRKNLKIQMDLKEKLHDVPDTEQEQHNVIHLKDESGHFKRETVVCVIALIGELDLHTNVDR